MVFEVDYLQQKFPDLQSFGLLINKPKISGVFEVFEYLISGSQWRIQDFPIQEVKPNPKGVGAEAL